MRNKKLIPFEVIEKAVAGETEAVDAVFQHYNAFIKYLPLLVGSQEDEISKLLSPSIYYVIGMLRSRDYFALDLCGFAGVEMTG